MFSTFHLKTVFKMVFLKLYIHMFKEQRMVLRIVFFLFLIGGKLLFTLLGPSSYAQSLYEELISKVKERIGGSVI